MRVVSFDIKTRDGGRISIYRKREGRRRREGGGGGIINLFESFPQHGLFEGLSLIFPSFGQEPSFTVVGHENDFGCRWLDDYHTGTQYEVRSMEDAVRYRRTGPLRQRVGRRFLEGDHYRKVTWKSTYQRENAPFIFPTGRPLTPYRPEVMAAASRGQY